MERMVNVAIIHRRRLIREGIAYMLSQQQGLTVIASVADTSRLLSEIIARRPDVVLIDYALPERDGLSEAKRLAKAFPDAKLLMIGLSELVTDILPCIEAGAAGYISQDASLIELFDNIWAVTMGEAICSPKVSRFPFLTTR